MTWTTLTSAVVGEKLSAAKVNQIKADLDAVGSAWASYAVSWTATTTNPTLGNGVLNGFYISAGKLTIVRVELTMGSTTAFGSGSYGFSLPATAQILAGAGGSIGTASLLDTSTSARSFRQVFLATSTAVRLVDDSGAAASPTVPWTWASGDSLTAQFMYEAA